MIKKSLFIICLSFLFNVSSGQTIEQEFFIDFGPNDVTNGNITSNPDTNGNYWNNLSDPSTSGSVSLISTINTSTSYNIEVSSPFLTNGILNGGLLAPSNILLGDVAINTATQDYFYSGNQGVLLFKNLNVNRGYEFKIFATRNASDVRQTKYNFIGLNDFKGILQTSGTDIGGSGYDGNNSTILSSGIIFPDCNGTIKLEVIVEAGNFAYLGLIHATEYSGVSYATSSDLRIAHMGSSVATGWNATMDQGYAYQYTDLLEDRFSNNTSANNWDITNISIPGNNTTDVMGRWGDHLVPECNKYKYVVYALSLGNEDVKNQGVTAYNRFRDNLLTLITNAENEGMIPIIANTYPSRQYGATEYSFLKQINLLIHEWDVPSINLLGGLDDSTGKWVDGFWDDDWHPNTIGHTELMYTLVPSLFDALHTGKSQPQKISNTYLALGSSISNNQLLFTPENTIHSFTNSFDIKTNGTGDIAAFTKSSGDVGYITINNSGYIVYTSPSGVQITGSTVVNDNTWHKVTITHYYAQRKTIIYTDKVASGNYDEQIVYDNFYLHPMNAPLLIDYRDWHFYRSAMTNEEVDALNDGKMLKSSLELYAPLDGQAVHSSEPLVNLAQSTNGITEELKTVLSLSNSSIPDLKIYPNPSTDFLEIPKDIRIKAAEICDITGKILESFNDITNNRFDLRNYKNGLYFLTIYSTDGHMYSVKVIKE